MIKIYNILGTKKRVRLNRSNDSYMFMEAISDEDEKLIDESKEEFSTVRFVNSVGCTIAPNDIFLYGEVDLTNEEDIRLIKKHDIITNEVYEASIVYSTFDYDEGTITSERDGSYKWYHTWNKLLWFKYNYCLLGKPKKVIIYKVNRILYDARRYNNLVRV